MSISFDFAFLFLENSSLDNYFLKNNNKWNI